LAAGDPPLGDGRPAAAGRDDDVALAGDGRQSHDAVQAQESDASRVQIASWQQQGKKNHKTVYTQKILDSSHRRADTGVIHCFWSRVWEGTMATALREGGMGGGKDKESMIGIHPDQ
jgi:hypothetical protein